MSDNVTPIDKAMRERHSIPVQPDPIRINPHPSAHNMLLSALESWRTDSESEETRAAITEPKGAWAMMMLAFNAICNTLDVNADDVIRSRRNFGLEKYGTKLQPFNGRNNLEDALDEIVDGLVYLICELYENIYTDDEEKK